MSKWKTIARALAATAAIASVPAQSATFVLNSLNAGTAAGTQARQGFEVATAYWGSVLTSNVTINLNIGFSTLGANILGSTSSASTTIYDATYYAALATHVTSTLDAIAVANLSPLTPGTGATAGTGAVTVIGNALNATNTGYVDTATRIDNDGSANNRGMTMNTSVAKALGLTSNYTGTAINYGAADGSVQFSNAYNFDFDPSDGIASNAIDFIGVAIHEIGHALGFRSGVDTYDAYTGPNATNSRTNGVETFINIGTQLDFFRYSSEGNLDWPTQNTPYFSIDGGKTQLFGDSLFATGVLNGDGRQASHWKDSASGAPQLGIMDPTSAYGQMQDVTALDLAAFDAIGWQVGTDVLVNSGYRMTTADIYRQFATSAVPEPESWGMLILGFGFVGGTLRYRRRRVAVRYAVAR